MQMAQIYLHSRYRKSYTHAHRKLEYNIEKCPEDCFVNLGFCNLKS